jgi:hypothetical protein
VIPRACHVNMRSTRFHIVKNVHYKHEAFTTAMVESVGLGGTPQIAPYCAPSPKRIGLHQKSTRLSMLLTTPHPDPGHSSLVQGAVVLIAEIYEGSACIGRYESET